MPKFRLYTYRLMDRHLMSFFVAFLCSLPGIVLSPRSPHGRDECRARNDSSGSVYGPPTVGCTNVAVVVAFSITEA
jgi:hypothetical protein